jgi:hypothetical protein
VTAKIAARAGIALALALAVYPAAGAEGPALTRPLAGGGEVDWASGTVSARGGAAGDYRLPSADVARLGAERRARAAARTALRAALEALPRGARAKLTSAELDRALDRARAVDVQYQSNGGVLLSLAVSFGDLVAPAPAGSARAAAAAAAAPAPGPAPPVPAVVPERALVVPSMPLELAPGLAAGEKEGQLAWAVYRTGAPPSGVKAISARRDKQGRLVLPASESLQSLARGPAVIYVQKILR